MRRLSAPELPALMALYRHLHDSDDPVPEDGRLETVWQQALDDPRIRYVGAYVGGELVASCTIALVPNLTRGCRPWGVIENVVTHAAHRGRGLGKAVLAEALAFAWAQGSYKVMLMTGRKDEATLRFYEGAGFDRQGKQAFIARPPG